MEKCVFVCVHVIVCVLLRMCAVDLVVPVILFLLTGMNTPLGWQCVEARPGRRAEESEKERQERRSTSDTTYLSPRLLLSIAKEREGDGADEDSKESERNRREG